MATNEDLGVLLREGKIREDYYHRISGITLTIPPLRRRLDDIKPLAEYYVKKFSHLHPAGQCTLDPGAIEVLKQYHWPGNVREFTNVIKSAIVYANSDVLTKDDFQYLLQNHPPGTNASADFLQMGNGVLPTYKEVEQKLKENYFQQVWHETNHDVKKTAEKAGITPQAARRILKSLGLR